MKERWCIVLVSGMLLSACGTAEPNEADNEALAACGTATCKEGFAQRIEEDSPFSMYDMPCIVQGLRDRTPGRYQVELNHTFTNGYEAAYHTLFITPSGAVEVGVRRVERYDIEGEPESEATWDPTQRCSLRSVDFFEACLAAVSAVDDPTAMDAAWDCVYPGSAQNLPWFEGCEEKAPTCE